MDDQIYLETFKRLLSQVKAMETEIKQILEDVPVTIQYIIEVERGETKNSGSPMWRCTTNIGERVNVFKHADPDKNNFALFADAGYGDTFLMLEWSGDAHVWKHHPIEVGMRKIGKWWEIVHVAPRPAGAAPDGAGIIDTDLAGDENFESGRRALDELRGMSLDLED